MHSRQLAAAASSGVEDMVVDMVVEDMVVGMVSTGCSHDEKQLPSQSVPGGTLSSVRHTASIMRSASMSVIRSSAIRPHVNPVMIEATVRAAVSGQLAAEFANLGASDGRPNMGCATVRASAGRRIPVKQTSSVMPNA